MLRKEVQQQVDGSRHRHKPRAVRGADWNLVVVGGAATLHRGDVDQRLQAVARDVRVVLGVCSEHGHQHRHPIPPHLVVGAQVDRGEVVQLLHRSAPIVHDLARPDAPQQYRRLGLGRTAHPCWQHALARQRHTVLARCDYIPLLPGGVPWQARGRALSTSSRLARGGGDSSVLRDCGGTRRSLLPDRGSGAAVLQPRVVGFPGGAVTRRLHFPNRGRSMFIATRRRAAAAGSDRPWR